MIPDAFELNLDALPEPKKKAVEHSGAIDLNAQRELESLMGMTEEQLVEIIRKEVGKK